VENAVEGGEILRVQRLEIVRKERLELGQHVGFPAWLVVPVAGRQRSDTAAAIAAANGIS
jgi:hypothetical protein